MKLDQKRLDQELDFILSQQKELEDLLSPLEESVKEQSGTVHLQHADEEREKTYKLAENIDAQLKRMAQDLKDIIEHLNTSGARPTPATRCSRSARSSTRTWTRCSGSTRTRRCCRGRWRR